MSWSVLDAPQDLLVPPPLSCSLPNTFLWFALPTPCFYNPTEGEPLQAFPRTIFSTLRRVHSEDSGWPGVPNLGNTSVLNSVVGWCLSQRQRAQVKSSLSPQA